MRDLLNIRQKISYSRLNFSFGIEQKRLQENREEGGPQIGQ
jgi:hypothetical protein